MSKAEALNLFAHGARDPDWAKPLEQVQTVVNGLLKQAQSAPVVRLAFLELMTPSLAECVAELLALGVTHAVVVPMFIAQGGHLKRDLPALLHALQQTHPQLKLRLAPAVGESEQVILAMAHTAISSLLTLSE
ncbi:MAG: CbiX/SirB N-terminal domain-containing protein [Pseudomonadota bacterium]